MTPGEYVPDPTEGIAGLEDLPQPRIQQRTRDFPSRRCPRYGDSAGGRTVSSSSRAWTATHPFTTRRTSNSSRTVGPSPRSC